MLNTHKVDCCCCCCCLYLNANFNDTRPLIVFLIQLLTEDIKKNDLNRKVLVSPKVCFFLKFDKMKLKDFLHFIISFSSYLLHIICIYQSGEQCAVQVSPKVLNVLFYDVLFSKHFISFSCSHSPGPPSPLACQKSMFLRIFWGIFFVVFRQIVCFFPSPLEVSLRTPMISLH